MTQAEYWQRRIDRLFDKYHAAAQTKQLYRQAYKKVEQDILRLYEELRDKGRLTTTQLYQYQRFLALRREIQKQCGAIDTALQANVTAALTNAYKETFEIVTDLIDSNSVWGIQNERMVQAVLKTDWSGDTYSRRIWKNTRSVAKRVEAAVTDCITRGTSKDVYVKQIKQTFNVGFNAADRIVRTELMHVLGVAQIDTYYADGIKRVKWLAEIDGRVCAACAGLNGKVFDIEEFVSGSREVIEHPNCRCTLLPVLDDEDELTDTDGSLTEQGKSGTINTIPKHENAVIDTRKFTEYALNPAKDANKAKAFQEALGYNLSNADALVDNIKSNLGRFNAVEKGKNGYGQKYEVLMTLTGANGKKANVKTAWIIDDKTKELRLTSAYVTKKKFKE